MHGFGSSYGGGGGFDNCGGCSQPMCGVGGGYSYGANPYAGYGNQPAYNHGYSYEQPGYAGHHRYANPYASHQPYAASYSNDYASSYPSYLPPPYAGQYPAYQQQQQPAYNPGSFTNSQSYPHAYAPQHNSGGAYSTSYQPNITVTPNVYQTSNTNQEYSNNNNAQYSAHVTNYPVSSVSPVSHPPIELASTNPYNNVNSSYQFKTISPVEQHSLDYSPNNINYNNMPVDTSRNHTSPASNYSPINQYSSYPVVANDHLDNSSSAQEFKPPNYSNNFKLTNAPRPVVNKFFQHPRNEEASSDSYFSPNNTTTYRSIAKFTQPSPTEVSSNTNNSILGGLNAAEQFYLNYISKNASYSNNLENVRAISGGENSSLHFSDTTSLFSLNNGPLQINHPNGINRSEERSILKFDNNPLPGGKLSPIRSIDEIADENFVRTPLPSTTLSSLILQPSSVVQEEPPLHASILDSSLAENGISLKTSPVNFVKTSEPPRVAVAPVVTTATTTSPIIRVPSAHQEPISILRLATQQSAGSGADRCDDNHPLNKPPPRQVKFAPINQNFD
jgi:hypothetical protein